MKILPRLIAFEWDKGNIDKNLVKHNVTDREAEEVFGNKPLLVNEDVEHSEKELRFQVLGKTNLGRLLFISFTIRNDKVRIISIRDMNKKERGVYEEKAKTYTKIQK